MYLNSRNLKDRVAYMARWKEVARSRRRAECGRLISKMDPHLGEIRGSVKQGKRDWGSGNHHKSRVGILLLQRRSFLAGEVIRRSGEETS